MFCCRGFGEFKIYFSFLIFGEGIAGGFEGSLVIFIVMETIDCSLKWLFSGINKGCNFVDFGDVVIKGKDGGIFSYIGGRRLEGKRL